MASTNKTANFDLNQWIETDPVIRTDFNADNQKIDAALAAQPYDKLMNITAEADAAQIELDLTDIDLTRYQALKIYVNDILSVPLAMTFNNNTGTIYATSYDGELTSFVNYAQLMRNEYPNGLTNPGGAVSIEILPAASHTAILSTFATATGNAASTTTANRGRGGCYTGIASGISFHNINSIQFRVTSGSIKTGIHITLWGVKA